MKRKGKIELPFEDGEKVFVKQPETIESRDEWSDAQDQLEDLERKQIGLNRGAQKTAEAAKINAWLYPLLHQEYTRLMKSYKRVGHAKLGQATRRQLNLTGKPELKTKVTQSRLEKWLATGRPENP
jgi:hypothetical protein